MLHNDLAFKWRILVLTLVSGVGSFSEKCQKALFFHIKKKNQRVNPRFGVLEGSWVS